MEKHGNGNGNGNGNGKCSAVYIPLRNFLTAFSVPFSLSNIQVISHFSLVMPGCLSAM